MARCRAMRSHGGESTTMLTVGPGNHRIACPPYGEGAAHNGCLPAASEGQVG